MWRKLTTLEIFQVGFRVQLQKGVRDRTKGIQGLVTDGSESQRNEDGPKGDLR